MKKKIWTIGIVVVIITFFIGISFAYFSATIQNLGIRNTNITTQLLGNLRLTGETVFTNQDLFPGEIGVQKFKVEPISSGNGMYEIDLNLEFPSIFRTDVEITLYRANNSESNVEVIEGTLTQSGNTFSKEDQLVVTNATSVYGPTPLVDNAPLVLHQEEYDTSFTSTDYYIVYHYKNNGVQNDQMNKTFQATVSAKLINRFNVSRKIREIVANADKNSTALIDKGVEDTGCTNTLAYDDFGNLRYVGKNPCNYVSLDGESLRKKMVYQIYVDGNINTNSTISLNRSGLMYPSKELCEEMTSTQIEEWNFDGTMECKKQEQEKYVIAFNGDISTNSPRLSSTNMTLELCNIYRDTIVDLIDGIIECRENPSTHKYQIYAYGFMKEENSYDTEQNCNYEIWNNGFASPSASPPGVYCTKEKYFADAKGYLNKMPGKNLKTNCQQMIEDSNTNLLINPDTSSNFSCKEYESDNYVGGWRIIGIVDEKIKLVQNESVGEYSWDTSLSKLNEDYPRERVHESISGNSGINHGWGINQWGESNYKDGSIYEGADLMKLLNPGYENNLDEDKSGNNIIGEYVNNSLYWNSGSGTCYSGDGNQKTSCDFTTLGLSNKAKSLITPMNWYVGTSLPIATNTTEWGISKKAYEFERSLNTGDSCKKPSADYSTCVDTIKHTPTWKGYVGLINLSDYGYATGGENRNTCLSDTKLENYHSGGCNTQNWLLLNEEKSFRFLNPCDRYGTFVLDGEPLGQTGDSDCVMHFAPLSKMIYGTNASANSEIYPVIYLKEQDYIISGKGTETDPYIIGIE